MAIEFNDNTQEDFPIFPIKEENSELDMYGVWIKKKPADNSSLSDTAISDTDKTPELEPDNSEIIEFSQLDNDINFDAQPLDSLDNTIEFENSLHDEENTDSSMIEFDSLYDNENEKEEHIIEYDELEDLPDFQTIEQQEDLQGLEENISENKTEETVDNMDSAEFETLDLDDFLSNDSVLDDTEKDKKNDIDEFQDNENSEDSDASTAVNLDLSFDKNSSEPEFSEKSGFSVSNQDIDFNNMLDELSESPSQTLDITEPETNDRYSETQEITDFDDIINGMEPGNHIENDFTDNEDKKASGIDMNITVDEDSDISAIAGKTSANETELDDIAIFTDTPEKKENHNTVTEKEEDDDIIIESTIIEAGNIDEIREENQKILNKSASVSTISLEEKKETGDKLDSLLDDVMGTNSQNAPIESVDIFSENPVETNTDTDITSISEDTENTSLNDEHEFDNLNSFDDNEIINEPVSNEENSVYFDDIEAVKNDLLDSDDFQNKNTIESSEFESEKIEDNGSVMPVKTDVSQQIQNPIQNDKATEILLQIAGELSSIKTELANLKEEMKSAKTMQNSSSVSDGIAFEETQDDKNKVENNGFFSDDDSDETIALTGDELNNILITADFTEENAKDESVLEDSDVEVETDNNLQMEEPLPEIEPEYINKLPDDVSYLDEKKSQEQDDEQEVLTENLEDNEETENHYIDIPEGFDEENIEEPDLEAFDMTIKELELPNGQSITLGDKDDISENLIIDSEADIQNEQSENNLSEDIVENNDVDLNEENVLDIEIEDKQPSVDELSLNDSFFDENESGEFKIENIPEDSIVDESSDESVLSAEEFDKAAYDISTLNLNTNMAEQINDFISSEDSSETNEIAQPEIKQEEQKEKPEVLPIHLKDEIKSVLIYMDQLLESLPDNKIEEFAKSEHFDTYKRLFEELGIS